MTSRTILAVGLMAAAATAQAETFPSGGVGTGVSKNVTHEVAEGHMVMVVNAEYSDFEMEAEGHPMSGMSGPCLGAMEVEAGEATGGGRCVFTDSDGETFVIAFTVTGLLADGSVTGLWETSGGAGKWAGATGGGGFVSMDDAGTGGYMNVINGEITMP